MKKKFTFLMAAMMLLTMILPWKAVGQEKSTSITYTFSSKSWEASNGNWSGNQDGNALDTKGVQCLKDVTYTVTSPTSYNSISQVVVTYGTAKSTTTSSTVSIKVGTGSEHSQNLAGGSQSGATLTYNLSPNESGSVEMKIESKGASTYIKSVKITYVQTRTITFHGNGGTYSNSDTYTQIVNDNEATNLTANQFVNSGYTFKYWTETSSDSGTTYADESSITLTANKNLYAQWQSASSPNIIINGGTALALANTASGAQTATVQYNNMSGYSSPSVALYNDSECTSPFTAGWLTASLSGEGSTTLNYSALANTAAERTVYIRVSAIYDKETITSVLAATQDPKTFTVTYNANGGSGTTADDDSPYVYGSEVIAIENAFTPPSGKIFNNWNTQADGEGDSYAVGAQITASITGAIVLYAQWVDEPTYTLIENVSQIVPGAHYIIAGGYTGTVKVMASQSTNNRSSEELTVTSKQIINPAASIYRFVLSGYEENWTFYDGNVSSTGYLYAASSSANYLKTEKTLDANDNGKWSITIGDNGACLIEAQGTNTRNKMRLNGSIFACYGDSNYTTYGPIYLFILDDDTNIYPYSPSTYSSGTTTINEDITITTDNAITIANGAKVVFKGNVTSETVSNLVVNDGGQLVVSNSGVNATFQKNITGYDTSKDDDNPDNDGYSLIAKPTTGNMTLTDGEGMLSNDYDLYYFDEKENGFEWRNYKAEAFEIKNGTGYLYANSENITLNFAGVVPTETSKSNISLSYTADNDFEGFNLMGNPLSVNITSMKINTTPCGYYKLNNDGTFTSVTNVALDPVVVGQGFMVEAKETTDKLHLNPAAKDEESFSNEIIGLEVGNSKYTDVAYICFGSMMPLTKINHMNDEAPIIYIHNEEADNAVAVYNNRGEVKSVDVNFEAKTTSTYTISAKMMKGEVKYMHLYDRLTGIDTDLLMDDYSFIGAKGDIAGRFILNLESVDNNSSTGSDTFAYQSGNDIIVNGEGTLAVYDVTGRKVLATTINGVETINGLNSGVYIFRIIGETLRTQKIVVR